MKQFLLFVSLCFATFFLTQTASSQDIRDKYGIKTGQVQDDGDIRDKHGVKTGHFDKDGVKIGTAKDVDMREAAVIFFFSDL